MEVFNCGLVLIRSYMRIYMYVWTYLHMGSSGTEVYIWKYLACNLETRFSFLHMYMWGWAKMKSFCRYANHECID